MYQFYISNTIDYSCNSVFREITRRIKEIAQRYKGGNSV